MGSSLGLTIRASQIKQGIVTEPEEQVVAKTAVVKPIEKAEE